MPDRRLSYVEEHVVGIQEEKPAPRKRAPRKPAGEQGAALGVEETRVPAPKQAPADPDPVLIRGHDDASTAEDRALDQALRPKRFAEFIGQKRVVENLALLVEASRRRNSRKRAERDPLDHILLSGLPGLGKTTLACLLAREAGVGMKATSGPAIEKAGDLAGILSNLERGDLLFIDEIHRLPAVVEEYLYSAMEDFAIDIVIDQGTAARTIKIDLKPFTLVGATTREGLLSAPFRSRFGVLEKLEVYPDDELEAIIRRSAGVLGVEIETEAARLLASRARGTPRVANRFLRRMRDVAEVRGAGRVTRDVATLGLRMLGVDDQGLDATDRRILEILVRHGGEPVGLKTIAVAVGEEEGTIEDVYEPYLIQRGYLVKTPRGRRPSEPAWRHLGLEPAGAKPAPRALFDL